MINIPNQMPGMAGIAGNALSVEFRSLPKPGFIVTVDTEEEFDWSASFTRDQHGTTHIPAIARFQALCDSYGVRPIYLVDYPIVTNADAVALLKGYVDQGRADIGIQLHPWVNPPFEEDVSSYNSYACNLPAELEKEKITNLFNIIKDRFSTHPKIYRAGRYGAGPTSIATLAELGVTIDSSVRAHFDYSAADGPNYAHSPLMPYWLIPDQMLELPLTTIFRGALRHWGFKLFPKYNHSPTLRALMARSGLLERISLTPEGIPLAKAKQAVDIAIADKLPILNFSFHSPSLAVGHTPYVRSAEDLEQFYAWWEAIFAYLSKRDVEPLGLDQIINAAIDKE